MNESPITRRSALKLAGAAGALGMAGLPIEALASDPEDAKKLFIGMDLHAVGPEATTGAMVMSSLTREPRMPSRGSLRNPIRTGAAWRETSSSSARRGRSSRTSRASPSPSAARARSALVV